MYKFVVFSIMILALTGCSDDEPQYSLDESAEQEVLPQKNIAAIVSDQGVKFGIGDVESAMRVETVLAPSALSGTVTQKISETKLEWIAKVDAMVAFPYPDKLEVAIGVRSVKNYPEHSSRVTTKLYVENDVVHTFKFITGKSAIQDKKIEIYDILPHLNLTETDTVLLHSRAEIEFFPNTPVEELTLDTPARSDTTRATKMGNPIRITFIP
ncbi:MAG: hypothetical protein VCD00_07285 [Candidatus Hydrogenedentota bacterium]